MGRAGKKDKENNGQERKGQGRGRIHEKMYLEFNHQKKKKSTQT